MKKLFSGFKVKDFIINLLICLAYPICKTIISENKLLVFSDTSFIMSLVFMIGGVVNHLIRSGDFDITTFIAARSFSKNKDLTFDKYKKDKESERKDSFNYLFFVGIIVFVISMITGAIY